MRKADFQVTAVFLQGKRREGLEALDAVKVRRPASHAFAQITDYGFIVSGKDSCENRASPIRRFDTCSSGRQRGKA